MLRVIAFSMILVFAGADQALAQDDDFARNGIYLSVNMGGAWYRDVQEDLEKEIGAIVGPPVGPPFPFPVEGVTVEEPLGLGTRVGYRFHPHFAAEVQLQWFANSAVRFFDEDVTETAIKFETLAFSGNVKAYLLTGRIQPFLLAGAGFMHFDAEDKLDRNMKTNGDSFAARFGAGIDFYFNPNIVGFAEGGYVLTTGELDGLDHVVWSIGLQYRF